MNRFLAGACAVSVLAAAYAAHAISDGGATTAQIAIHGTVNPFCAIVTTGPNQPAWVSDNDYSYSKTSSGATVSFSTFANTDGTGNALSGSYQLDVNNNTPCSYQLTSLHGALKNQNSNVNLSILLRERPSNIRIWPARIPQQPFVRQNRQLVHNRLAWFTSQPGNRRRYYSSVRGPGGGDVSGYSHSNGRSTVV